MSAPTGLVSSEDPRERLYRLLPAIYRKRDSETGLFLEGLLSVMDQELRALEQDIEEMYADFFVETCAPWIVPYLGDLLGVRGLSETASDMFSQRAFVANVLRHRRRKGTPPVLEEVARDVTDWPARVVEFFHILSTTQHLKHIRPGSPATVSLRNAEALERIGGAFDESPHTADIRHIASGRGRHNISHVGLFVWRIESYPIVRGTARLAKDAAGNDLDGCYTFNPLGLDMVPLFNPPVTEREITHVAEEINVPTPLRRRLMFEDLQSYRDSGWRPDATRYFGEDPAFEVSVEGEPSPVPAVEISICDLSSWLRPGSNQPLLSVDPALGRLAFRDVPQGDVLVSYSYGFSADIGGGPYDRQASVEEAFPEEVSGQPIWQIGVTKDPPGAGLVVDNLQEAVDRWNDGHAEPTGIISILDSRSYQEDLTADHEIVVPPGKTLLVVAALWPETEQPDRTRIRVPGRITPTDVRPHLRGEISVSAGDAGPQIPGAAVFDGLLIEGSIRVSPGDLGRLRVAHCTLAPPTYGIAVGRGRAGPNDRVSVNLDHSICGPVDLHDTAPFLRISDSIVDAASGVAIDANETEVRIDRSSVFGVTRARTLHASNSIFSDAVAVRRRQEGCVRFTYVPFRSSTPRRYRCQPDLALEARAEELHLASVRNLSLAQRNAVLTRVRPGFTSREYGQPGYVQLSAAGPQEIANGGAEGGEMGAFSYLKQPQRAANLRFRLDEYLPFGLEAGLIYET